MKRGKWVMETILGTPSATPPANVPEIEKQKLQGTLRQRMEQHRANPACVPVMHLWTLWGFDFANFDAIGAWRDKEGGYPIDALENSPDGAAFTGPKDLTKLLSRQKIQFLRCLTEKMLTYALGRGLAYYDACEVTSLTRQVAADNGKLASLVWEIVRRSTVPDARSLQGENDSMKPINRRTMLKGLGVAVGLPFLESMSIAQLVRGDTLRLAAPCRFLLHSQRRSYARLAADERRTGIRSPSDSAELREVSRPSDRVFRVDTWMPVGPTEMAQGIMPRAGSTFLTGLDPVKTAGSNIRVGNRSIN